MANKRVLKKQIRYACGDVALHSIITRECMPDADTQKLNDVVLKAAELQSITLQHVTFAFDKTPGDFENRSQYRREAARYYKKAYRSLIAQFNKELQKIVDLLNEATPKAK